MLMAVGATNSLLAAALALPTSTTSQKYRNCFMFNLIDPIFKKQNLNSV
jgi:hypothetical protein